MRLLPNCEAGHLATQWLSRVKYNPLAHEEQEVELVHVLHSIEQGEQTPLLRYLPAEHPWTHELPSMTKVSAQAEHT